MIFDTLKWGNVYGNVRTPCFWGFPYHWPTTILKLGFRDFFRWSIPFQPAVWRRGPQKDDAEGLWTSRLGFRNYSVVFFKYFCAIILLQLIEFGNQSCATVATRRILPLIIHHQSCPTCTMLGVLGVGVGWGNKVRVYLRTRFSSFKHSVLRYESQNTIVRASKYDLDNTTLKFQNPRFKILS